MSISTSPLVFDAISACLDLKIRQVRLVTRDSSSSSQDILTCAYHFRSSTCRMGPDRANDWLDHEDDSNSGSASSSAGLLENYHTDIESARSTFPIPSFVRRLDAMAVKSATKSGGSLSESGLQHFKTYKYSSVDKSPISYYILRHYVRHVQFQS